MKDSFLAKRIRGGGYAIKGAWILIKTEPSIQVQALISVVVCFAGFYFDITKTYKFKNKCSDKTKGE